MNKVGPAKSVLQAIFLNSLSQCSHHVAISFAGSCNYIMSCVTILVSMQALLLGLGGFLRESPLPSLQDQCGHHFACLSGGDERP